jgi:isopenicillin N synthase-like dioxygenase
MAHYPYRTDLSDEFGIGPHTDTSFLTLLAPNEVHSLSIRTQTGKRIDGPTIPGAFAVNGGQLLQRWTNDYFLPTPHRTANRSGVERYALASVCDAGIDRPIAATPTRIRPDKAQSTRQLATRST